MKLLNLSNHKLTETQLKEISEMRCEVVELDQEDKQKWGQLTPDNYRKICDEILIKYNVEAYHLAGFPAAVVYVSNIMENCFYAYSERNSIEVQNPDGTVEKKVVFEHKGFYRYPNPKDIHNIDWDPTIKEMEKLAQAKF